MQEYIILCTSMSRDAFHIHISDDLYQLLFMQLVIQGDVQYRLGVLLLSEGQVEVLGGMVEHLAEANAPRKVLARLL